MIFVTLATGTDRSSPVAATSPIPLTTTADSPVVGKGSAGREPGIVMELARLERSVGAASTDGWGAPSAGVPPLRGGGLLEPVSESTRTTTAAQPAPMAASRRCPRRRAALRRAARSAGLSGDGGAPRRRSCGARRCDGARR